MLGEKTTTQDSLLDGSEKTEEVAPVESLDVDIESIVSTDDEDSEKAFNELQNLIVGSERKTIKRLEGAVKGFLTAVINDDELEALVTDNVNASINKHIAECNQQINETVKQLTEDAITREFLIMRGTLPEKVAPSVDLAIKERIKVANTNIEAIMEPVFKKIIDDLIAKGKQEICNQLYPEVSRAIEEKVSENLSSVRDFVAETIDAILREGMRTEVGQQLANMVDYVTHQAVAKHRKITYLTIGISAFILILTFLFMHQQGKKMDSLRNKIQNIEKFLPSIKTNNKANP